MLVLILWDHLVFPDKCTIFIFVIEIEKFELFNHYSYIYRN